MTFEVKLHGWSKNLQPDWMKASVASSSSENIAAGKKSIEIGFFTPSKRLPCGSATCQKGYFAFMAGCLFVIDHTVKKATMKIHIILPDLISKLIL